MKVPVSYFNEGADLRFARVQAQCDLLRIAVAISANSPSDQRGRIRDNAVLSRILSCDDFPEGLPHIYVWELAERDLPLGGVAASVDRRGGLRLSIAFTPGQTDARTAIERAYVSPSGQVSLGPDAH